MCTNWWFKGVVQHIFLWKLSSLKWNLLMTIKKVSIITHIFFFFFKKCLKCASLTRYTSSLFSSSHPLILIIIINVVFSERASKDRAYKLQKILYLRRWCNYMEKVYIFIQFEEFNTLISCIFYLLQFN